MKVMEQKYRYSECIVNLICTIVENARFAASKVVKITENRRKYLYVVMSLDRQPLFILQSAIRGLLVKTDARNSEHS